MHRMQSGGWPYSEDGRDSSKAPSLRVAFLRTAMIDHFQCPLRAIPVDNKATVALSSPASPALGLM